MEQRIKIISFIFFLLVINMSCSNSTLRSKRFVGLNRGVIFMQSHLRGSQERVTINNHNYPPYGLYVAFGFVYLLSIFLVIVEACYCKCFEARDCCWILLVVIFVPFISFIVCPIVKKCCDCQM